MKNAVYEAPPVTRSPVFKVGERAVYPPLPAGTAWWSSDSPVPEIGDEVRVKINGIGWGRVVGYQVIDGFLGIWVDAREKPRWYLDQNGNVPGLSFGAELEMGPS